MCFPNQEILEEYAAKEDPSLALASKSPFPYNIIMRGDTSYFANPRTALHRSLSRQAPRATSLCLRASHCTVACSRLLSHLVTGEKIGVELKTMYSNYESYPK